MEASLGVRLLTETRTSNDHEFSTAFQFAEYVGAAYGRFDVVRDVQRGARLEFGTHG